MNDGEFDVFRDVLSMAFDACGGKGRLNDFLLRVWWESCKPYSLVSFRAALRDWLANSSRVPTPREIVALIPEAKGPAI